jgi:hypothetical protein
MKIARIIRNKRGIKAVVVFQDSDESTETIMRQHGLDDQHYDFRNGHIMELRVDSGSHPVVQIITS